MNILFQIIDFSMWVHSINTKSCTLTHSVTQVLDLRVHLEKHQLPLSWEKVVEVVHRDWTVKPAVRKHRAALERLQMSNDRSDASLRYIARPSHLQDPHTGHWANLS